MYIRRTQLFSQLRFVGEWNKADVRVSGRYCVLEFGHPVTSTREAKDDPWIDAVEQPSQVKKRHEIVCFAHITRVKQGEISVAEHRTPYTRVWLFRRFRLEQGPWGKRFAP